MRLALRGIAICLLAFTSGGCLALPMAASWVAYQNPLGYKTLDVEVTDADSGQPIAGVEVSTNFDGWRPYPKGDYSKTDDRGRARLRAWGGEPNFVYEAEGYIGEPVSVRREPKPEGRHVHVALSKPVVINVELVLPDRWSGVLNVYEGEPLGPPAPGLRDTIQPKEMTLRVVWDESAGPPSEANPLQSVHLPTAYPHERPYGITFRVAKARHEGGAVVPVYRDAMPPDGGSGFYFIGTSGFGNSVFVLGTLADALTAEQEYFPFQWQRNPSLPAPVQAPAAGGQPGR